MHGRLWRVIAALVVGGGLSVSTTARALEWESLVMPGEVIAGHAKYERRCGECHAPFRRAVQKDLCLGCHEAVAADLTAGRGYHGRDAEIARKNCEGCHPDHEGRDADIVPLDEVLFDHRLTDYALLGAHQAAPCRGCHPAGVKHRDASDACVDCHRQDSPHKARLGEACAVCHGERSWQQVAFDHDTTGFALEGSHARMLCVGCHPNQRYDATPTDCRSCHALEDVHRGKFGDTCQSCHGPQKWTETTFDHDAKTDFPLAGRHRVVPCTSCHPGSLYEEKLGTACVTCHASDDAHHGHYGRRCEACHQPEAWPRIRFDHDADTEYPLKGAHRDVRCQACHPGDLYKDQVSRECSGCHRADDVHERQQGDACERCHAEGGWRVDVAFDHDLSRLPLLGLHAIVPCEACHVNSKFKDADSRCIACHQGDDVHGARLGPECALCHTPNGWRLWRFDHDAETRFPLDGAHVEVACEACHRRPVRESPSLPTGCRSCHAADDVHRGSFGSQCQQCHDTSSFSDTRLR
jgi:hypothetical protein